MCFASGPEDKSAAIAREQEAERQALVTQGRGQIDKAFSGFDDAFFGNAARDYRKHYMPQVKRQAEEARERMVLQLASSGNLESSTGADSIGKLDGRLAEQRTRVASDAMAHAAKLRSTVDQNRNQLYDLNMRSADPAGAGRSAASAAGALTAPVTYSPLVNGFSDLLQTGATSIAAQNQGYRGLFPGVGGNPARPGGSSVRVVR